jgi:hypothetical protein
MWTEGADVVEKIRLNDAQWAQLVGLANGATLEQRSKPIRCPVRLRSNGLISKDASGGFHLTERGVRRLGQGR